MYKGVLNAPFVNIRITKENGEPTSEQKQELIAGVTDLLAKVLNKNKASTVVIIDEIDTDNYGLGGKSITQVRKEKS
ncbi:4-oxalocrotonate tautomerase family protein [Campylobacter coli]|uniref:4-oxalocrotonate tautomerase family protein n=3 Tax=Campylobacter coli TaxID=195 RepID=UPI00234F1814|nr:4-oxalocrotonate tautomerase family protein [Campylobacter coli]MDC7790969.1 4-oxalocrotonate tautomerase family protein [Campylobacter coli]MDC7793694.1 4-oxalocrotonate tautomerase family protein [Campylobacter coli]